MDLLQFEPLLRQMLWGGDKIIPYKGLETDMDHVGESWELSAMPGFESVVSRGKYAGRTLTEVVAERKDELVGRANYARFGNRFPLLVKFIDAARDLSIQVHPGDELAARLHGTNGKTEMWYVVDAEPGAGLLSGFSKRITPEEYERRVADKTLTEVLRRYDVRPGDLYFLPAGCVHNIGAGVFTVEIQQTSDLTYRIWDFERLDERGQPRELHTDLAREAIDYACRDDSRTVYHRAVDRRVPLLSCPYFTTALYELTREYVCDFSSLDSFVVMVFIGGEGVVDAGEGGCTAVRCGQTLLVPASAEQVRVVPGRAPLRFLTACVAS